ncbi:MAG TPA: hypothetical protein VHH36_02115, partial [Candidatus Thermoplasmatota archaeon]|nr:hypothetical protein [Candidatus Thermoplasmatota archaeon]
EAPGFLARDAKVALRFPYLPVADASEAGLRDALRAALPRLGPKALPALDARGTGAREFEVAHALYGRVTLFEHRRRPSESADWRLDAARERGWTRTLKEHNLLPGRGLVVLDEDQGLFLREPDLSAIEGLLVLLDDGHARLWWNPVAPTADPEMQYWLAWGRGEGGPSEWRQVLRVDEADGDP